MITTLVSNELLVRFIAFAGVFAAMAVWEVSAPRRGQQLGRHLRWPSNIGVVVVDTVLVRLVFPTTVIALALVCEVQEWGLFQVLDWPVWATIPLAFIGLDFAI